MFVSLAAAVLALQAPPRAPDAAARRDTSRSVCIGIGCPSDRAPQRIPVTAEHLRTAFRDTAARTLLLRARAARLEQDSAIVSYDASAYQRMSAGLNVSRLGRERVIFRSENAVQVRWHRDAGAHVDVKGSRHVFPGMSRDKASREMQDDISDMTLLPYYPGHETLWIGNGLVRAEVDENEMVHPLAEGAEAYYTYATGDAAGFRLPDGREVRLRELKVRPRTVRWNLVVGSLWFDVARGQLVRAAYRLAEPLDIWAEARRDDPDAMKDVPLPLRGLLTPMRGQITAMAVEYGLHQGRFWLPRLQFVEGEAQAGFVRIPFTMQQSYRYASVNALALDSLPRVQLPASSQRAVMPDSLSPEDQRRWRDSTRAARREAQRARADSIKQGLVKSYRACDTGTVYTAWDTRAGGTIPVMVRVPCDAEALAASPELPGSIFAAGEELFDAEAREALIADALSLGAQPAFGLRPPAVEYGLQLLRFNRIEGLSLGVRATQQIGSGYAADATLRFGLADREPNAELGLSRTNLARTVRLGAYNRLVSAGDWGAPLSVGSSLSALLWGRDDGFYYRASGADLTGTRHRGAAFTWRLFAEQQRRAAMENSFSLAKAVSDRRFQENIVAERGYWGGASLRAVRTLGLDPRGLRLFGDARLEAAAGARDSGGAARYGRFATDLTLSRAVGPVESRAPLAALTLSGGSTVGDVPAQRLWYLGGTETVRGQPPGTAAGDAYWFARGELAQDVGVARVSLFGDAGWAGARTAFSNGPAMSGVGAGIGVLDGLVRLDVARGIRPHAGWRTNLYLDARF